MTYRPLSDEDLTSLTIPPETAGEWDEIDRLLEQARRANNFAAVVQEWDDPCSRFGTPHNCRRCEIHEALADYLGDEQGDDK